LISDKNIWPLVKTRFLEQSIKKELYVTFRVFAKY